MPLSPDEQAELEQLRREFELCSLGDRPQSPSVSKIRRKMKLEAELNRAVSQYLEWERKNERRKDWERIRNLDHKREQERRRGGDYYNPAYWTP